MRSPLRRLPAEIAAPRPRPYPHSSHWRARSRFEHCRRRRAVDPFGERLDTRKPAVAVARRLRLREASVGELGVARLLFDAGPVVEGDLVHGVRAAVAVHVDMSAAADRQDGAGAVPGSDDDVPGLGGTVHEVPLPQRPFLALDDDERLAGEYEEVLLVGFPVVHPDRLAWPEEEQVDSEL